MKQEVIDTLDMIPEIGYVRIDNGVVCHLVAPNAMMYVHKRITSILKYLIDYADQNKEQSFEAFFYSI